jgi:hypothetical protein
MSSPTRTWSSFDMMQQSPRASFADAAVSSSIRQKRPDAWAVHWGRQVVFMLEFTRPNDGADDWQTRTDAYKDERCRPLRDKLAALLLPGWKVETMAFFLGIRGSF